MKQKFNLSKNDGLGRYYCYYGEEELGYIEYYKKWKRWVWNQGEDIIMSKECLKKVIESIEKLK